VNYSLDNEAEDFVWATDDEKREHDEAQFTEPDAKVENHGSLFLVQPITVRAAEWLLEHTADDAIYWVGALVVEPRYAEALVAGMRESGLTVE
jgi:hypothetical protein